LTKTSQAGQRLDGKVPHAWELVGGVGSATSRRRHHASSDQELFLSAGTLRQVLDRGSNPPLPKLGHTYVLTVTVAVDAGRSFQGATVTLGAGNSTLASRSLGRDFIEGDGSVAMLLRVIRDFTPAAFVAVSTSSSPSALLRLCQHLASHCQHLASHCQPLRLHSNEHTTPVGGAASPPSRHLTSPGQLFSTRTPLHPLFARH
jgi:hypothetical protein